MGLFKVLIQGQEKEDVQEEKEVENHIQEEKEASFSYFLFFLCSFSHYVWLNFSFSVEGEKLICNCLFLYSCKRKWIGLAGELYEIDYHRSFIGHPLLIPPDRKEERRMLR